MGYDKENSEEERNSYNIIEISKIPIHVNFLHPFLSNSKAKNLLLKC